jgi:hypothetical protein
LKENLDKISRFGLFHNPSIFEYDYKEMKRSKREINEEVIQYFFHPIKIKNYLENGLTIEEVYKILNN